MFTGGCHCGLLRIEFHTGLRAADLPLRACQCDFCRRHATVATTDPQGRIVIHAADRALLSRYAFGMHTAEYLLCARCGVYVAAITPEAPRTAIAIVNALDDRAAFTGEVVPTDYSAEDRAARIARRRESWTPAELRLPPHH